MGYQVVKERYRVTVSRVQTIVSTDARKSWLKGDDDRMAWIDNPNPSKTEETIQVYEQHVDTLDIQAVIAAVNK